MTRPWSLWWRAATAARLARLYQASAGRLFSYLLRLAGDRGVAEEMPQGHDASGLELRRIGCPPPDRTNLSDLIARLGAR